jgi:aspartate aminotransferase-like enzyme
VGLREALFIIKGIGLEKLFSRYALMADSMRKAAVTMGLELLAPESPSNSITAIKAPDGVDGKDIVRVLRETYGITVAGGQGGLKGKIFRIAHMGYVDRFDILLTICAVEMTLSGLGFPIELGRGIRVAEELLKDLD